MSNKPALAEKHEAPKAPAKNVRTYYLPDNDVSVQASSALEAAEKVKKTKEMKK